ncbi:MAG: sporulation protein YtxC [Bacillota bacterium]
MELYSISTKEPYEFLKNKLDEYFVKLKSAGNDMGYEITVKPEGKLTFLSCDLHREYLSPQSNLWGNIRYYAANAVADTILEHMERKLLQRMLRNEYGYFDRGEQGRILQLAAACLNTAGDADGGHQNISRRNLILFRALEYLDSNKCLNIEGFIRFWLKDYWLILQESLQKAVDKFLVEREQKEFVRLLQYFLEIQDPRYAEINVVERDGKYVLLDEDWREIDYSYLSGLVNIRFHNEISAEDCLLSALVTLAPQTVCLHHLNPGETVQIIEQVFRERMVICLGCKRCTENMGKKKEK